ncbi:MAG: T9SS type A sorting domain-containing protein [Flavobacteriales bacterium]|nr:T9SS type A sorting domain-containing protein [Flavobacteriales bacterium]
MNNFYKITLGLFLSGSAIVSTAQSTDSNRQLDPSNMREGESVEYCTQHKKMLEMLKNPAAMKIYQAEQVQFEQELAAFKSNKQQTGYSVDTIPVVFHVLHNEGVEKISRAQILDALAIMNRDYAKLNADTANVVSSFQSIIGKPNIHFALATKAPNGQCFSGITWTRSALSYQGDDGNAQVQAIISGNDVYNQQWPGDEYLNIFICGDIGGAAGYTYNPSGWIGGSMYNGIWVLHNYVGSIGTSSTYTSRTLTHEAGHWLNLSHTWGGNNNPGNASSCGSDDGVSDTPNTIGVTACILGESTCGPLANVENYMDYSYCSKMFTEGQVDRMRTALASSTGGRNNLTTNSNLISTGVRDYSLCKAEFESDNIVICEGQTVQFTDGSYHSANGWTWTFNGGSPASSTDQNPSVTYSTAGTYSVILTATDGSSSDTETKTNYITVLPATGRSLDVIEGFESLTLPNSEWFVENPDGSNAWAITTSAAATGSRSLKLNNSANDDGDVDEFVSSTIDLSNATDMELSFKYAFAKKASDNTDYLRVYVSSNCGETWSVRKNISSSTIATASNTSGNFVPGAGDWETVTVTNITASYWTSNFRFKISFVSGGGNNVYIDDINLFDPNNNSLGVRENDDVSLFRVFPNPARDIAKVSFDLVESNFVKVSINDMLGQEVQIIQQSELSSGTHQFEINTNLLSQGIYFVNLAVDGKIITQKLIVE